MAAPAPASAVGRRRFPLRGGAGGMTVVRWDRLGVSTRVHTRSVLVTLVLAAVTAVVFAWSITVGDFPIPLVDVLSYLVGRGTDDAGFIIGQLRLPRGLTAVTAGAAFGVSGAIFQRVARNPLASPDIIGINTGAAAAAAAAVFTIVVVGARR